MTAKLTRIEVPAKIPADSAKSEQKVILRAVLEVIDRWQAAEGENCFELLAGLRRDVAALAETRTDAAPQDGDAPPATVRQERRSRRAAAVWGLNDSQIKTLLTVAAWEPLLHDGVVRNDNVVNTRILVNRGLLTEPYSTRGYQLTDVGRRVVDMLTHDPKE